MVCYRALVAMACVSVLPLSRVRTLGFLSHSLRLYFRFIFGPAFRGCANHFIFASSLRIEALVFIG